MQNLATIRKVKEVLPIDKADNIQIAKVDGWQCVIKKDEFKSGDLAVYFEIDSFLPLDARYEFLRKSSFKTMFDGSQGFHLKTIKLKGQLSQGLLIPINKFPELIGIDHVGYDVTTKLAVKKYERPLPPSLRGKVYGSFPSFIPKTDQINVQNIENLDEIVDIKFEITLKLNGSSMTVYRNDGNVYQNRRCKRKEVHLGVCSRNLEIKLEDTSNAFVKCAIENKLIHILSVYNKNIALQGELVGVGIQNNYEKMTGLNFFLFDIYDIDNQRYLLSDERRKVLSDLNCLLHSVDFPEIRHVPMMEGSCSINDIFNGLKNFSTDDDFSYIDALLWKANAKSMIQDVAEGIVFKSMTEKNGKIISFKVINNKFLLENND